MPKLGQVEVNEDTGEQEVVSILPTAQVEEMLGADPALAYTDPDIATRMVELVAESESLVMLGDPEMFAPGVLEIVGPFLEDASDAEAEMMYGESEGVPMESEAPVEMSTTETVNPSTGEEMTTETMSANVGDSARQVTAAQLAKLLNQGSADDGEEDQREAMMSLLAELSGGSNGA